MSAFLVELVMLIRPLEDGWGGQSTHNPGILLKNVPVRKFCQKFLRALSVILKRILSAY